MFSAALLKIEKTTRERTWNIIIKDVRERGGQEQTQKTYPQELERKWAYIDQERKKDRNF